MKKLILLTALLFTALLFALLLPATVASADTKFHFGIGGRYGYYSSPHYGYAYTRPYTYYPRYVYPRYSYSPHGYARTYYDYRGYVHPRIYAPYRYPKFDYGQPNYHSDPGRFRSARDLWRYGRDDYPSVRYDLRERYLRDR